MYSTLSMNNGIIKFLKEKAFVEIKDLGRGGLGITKLLRDESIDELFVCKKYQPICNEFISQYYESFVNEIKLLYRINHPNIVRVFNYYLYPENLTGYILMEYIEGTDIESYIRQNPSKINDCFIQLINGFKYLEECSILHRDIRPSNILVSKGGIVKIIDFGFGKEIYSPSDCDKSISINWYYSIPQDFEQSTYTHCTEIYFLGKLFEHLIQEYNLAYLFKYGEIVEQMTKPKQTDRIESFYAIQRSILNDNALLEDFSEDETAIYTRFADNFTAVCSQLRTSTQYIENIDDITNSLKSVCQNSALETYIQNNQILINSFIKGSYTYKRKKLVPVSDVKNFYVWWLKLSNRRKQVVLSNLWVRLDAIERSDKYELPF